MVVPIFLEIHNTILNMSSNVGIVRSDCSFDYGRTALLKFRLVLIAFCRLFQNRDTNRGPYQKHYLLGHRVNE